MARPSTSAATDGRERNAWRPLVAPLSVLAAIAVLATLPVSAPEWAPWTSHVVHALVYGGLTWTLLRAWRALHWPRPRTGAVVLAVALGAAHELMQAFLPWRQGALGDVVPGALAAVAVALVDRLRRRPKAS